MVNVKRIDLGADIVALPERNLICLHPDLNYAESLGAIMGTLPGIHPDVAKRIVEKVTPRPCYTAPPRRVLGSVRAAVVAFVIAVAITIYSPGTPALASAEFGPDWSAAASSLGLRCQGTGHTARQCVTRDGQTVRMYGYPHQTGTLYLTRGGGGAIIFVFRHRADAERYGHLHPDADRHGRAVIWG